MSNPIISVVTGANSGIGRATALHLAAQGHRVFGTVRSLDKAGKLHSMAADLGVEVELIELDIAEDDSVRDGFAHILAMTDGVRLEKIKAQLGGRLGHIWSKHAR